MTADEAAAHNDDAERIVLGALMLQPQLVNDIAAVLTSGDFYRPAHTAIYSAITANAANGKPTDPVAVALTLNAIGSLARVGGAGYLHTCTTAVPTVANAPWYADQVATHADARRAEVFGMRLQDVARTGDRGAIGALVEQMQRELTAQRGPATPATTPLDWNTFLTETLAEVEWLPGRLAVAGQQIALVGDGKAGKSLLALEWAWRMAAGLPFLGDVGRRPTRVLYVDQENSHEDIQGRLLALGATPADLSNLKYLSFPSFRPLNTREGSAALLTAVEEHAAEVVFFDTISRMVEGKENDSDPWLDLYRQTMQPLKARRVSSCRLDHFGKDKGRGSRGSSAKTQDVDHVWELSSADGGLLELRRTHTRTGIGEDRLMLRRMGDKVGDQWKAGATRHVLAANDDGARETGWIGAKTVAKQLDDLGIPVDWGRDRVRRELKDRNVDLRVSNDLMGDAIAYRRSGDRLAGR